jgi:choline-sulfatase
MLDLPRRSILTLLLVGALWGAAVNGSASPRKNVLFLVIDDLNTWLLGDTNRYAGKVVAPNIRRLAASGVLFERAYTASPVCSPSRTALLSGVRPWQSGVYENGVAIDQSAALKTAVALPKRFKDAGYSLVSYGKIAHGWDTRDIWDERLGHKRDPAPPGAPFLSFTRGEQDWGPTHLAESEMNDTKYADAAIRQLRKRHDRPFFIACGLFHPHMPWYVPQKYFDLYPLEGVATPELLSGDLDDVPPLGREVTRGKSHFVEQVLRHGKHREGVRAYLAATSYADAQMGRVLQALEDSPHRDDTIVVLLSDHGFHLGEKNHWQKATLWEEATHSLLMLRVPGMTRAGGVSRRFVSLQDIYPTLMELCGIDAPDAPQGRSLTPLLRDPAADWSSTAITAFGDRYITIRTEQFRYIRYRDDQEELYDFSKDPRQWTNVVRQKEYSAALDKLRAAVPSLAEMQPPAPSKRRR